MTYPPQPPESNPYGAAPGGGPAGPPPQQGGPYPGHHPGHAPAQGDFATQWGIKENPARPKKVNQLTQLLWAYFALSALMALLAIVALATIPFIGAFVAVGGIIGLIFHGLSIAMAWFITKDKLGAFGAADPRVPLYIGFGLLGLFSLGGLFSGGWGWYLVLGMLVGLARLVAVGAGFYLLFQPEVEQYLKSRPGNLPKPPHQPPPHGYPQQPPGPGQAPPQGYPPEM